MTDSLLTAVLIAEFLLDLFDLVRQTDEDYFLKEEFALFLTEVSNASHIPPSALRALIDATWQRISKDGRVNYEQFAAYISPFELHSFMTVDFIA